MMLRKCLFLSIVMAMIPSLSACHGDAVAIEEEQGELVNEVSADVVHEMINRGETVEFKDAVITGELLDNGQLTVPTKSVSIWPSDPLNTYSVKVIKSQISFTDCIFREYVELHNVLFENEVSFKGCHFDVGRTESEWGSSTSLTSGQALFESDVSFKGTEFEGEVHFSDCHFIGNADFSGATFHGRAIRGSAVFYHSLFDGRAYFRSSTFENEVCYHDCTFNDWFDLREVVFQDNVDFSGTRLCGDAWLCPSQFGGNVYPPKSFTGNRLHLYWEEVKHTVSLGDAARCYPGWENLFLGVGDYQQTRAVRRAWTRHELGLWLLLWLVVFTMVTFVFALRYYRRFRTVPRRSRLQHFRKVLLFSLDVLTPGIGAYKYNWETSLPVNEVVVLTSIESALGWILLGAGAAIGVSWLVA